MRLVVLISCVSIWVPGDLHSHAKMYVKLDAVYPCIKRLNATHSIGCSSSRNGNIGVVHVVRNQSALDWVLKSPPHNPYVVVLTLNMLTNENLKKLNSSSKVNGVLVIQDQPRNKVGNFSPDYTCPNKYSGIKIDCTISFNPWGTGILWESWNMPIYFTDDEYTIKDIDNCFNKFNLPLDDSQLNRPLCALELIAQMTAFGNSLTCLERSSRSFNANPTRYCDVLGDSNIYVPIVPYSGWDNSKETVLVTTRLDAGSMFLGRTIGAKSMVISLVTLIFTAKLLYQLSSEDNLFSFDTNVMFIFFNGETFDYTGSVKTAFDFQYGFFPYQEKPLDFRNIKMFIELSQLAPDIFYYHSRYNEAFFMDSFKKIAQSFGYILPHKISSRRVVPSSFQSFLHIYPEFRGFVLSSYDEIFHNRFYNSLYDDYFNIKYRANKNSTVIKFIAEFSTVLAHSLYRNLLHRSTRSKASTSYSEVDKLLDCYLNTFKCKFAEEISFDSSNIKEAKPNSYVGIFSERSDWTTFTKHTLIHFMSKKLQINLTECEKLMQDPTKTMSWIPDKSVCLESYVNTTLCISPAFLLVDYDWSSNVYPTWTESFRQVMSVRMFVQPSSYYRRLVLILGIVIYFISFFTTYMIKKYIKKLFKNPNPIIASNKQT